MAVLRLGALSCLLLTALAGCSDGGGAGPEPAEVGIHNFQFDPASVTLAEGQAVVFANHDPAPHTATADGGAFDSGNLDQGEEYEVELPPGSYPYHCKLHPQMRGTLTVG